MALVERRSELDELGALLDDCSRGGGRAALISGGLASGKTELLHHFTEQALASGALALTATGSRAERTLHMGVIRQLFDRAALPLEIDGLPGSADGPSAPDATTLADRSSAQFAHSVCTALLALARDRPVVIGIDDIQFADSLSLQVLQYLQRRMRSAKVLLVLTELAQPRPVHPLFRAEILSQRHATHLELAPLSRAGVAELLKEHVPAASVESVATVHHALSGGNPLLVHALIEDYHSAGAGVQSPETVVGHSFGQAVLDCLHRWEPGLLTTARGVAVLDEATTPARLGRLVGIKSETAAHALDMLHRNGLVDDGRFRHPVAKAAVLDSLPSDERAELRLRAAEQLFQEGAAACAVADHLVAADRVSSPWAVSVLKHAGAQALSEDRVDYAVRCLELARRGTTDQRECAEITRSLFLAEYRRGPARTERHAVSLRSAFANGCLSGDGVATMIKHLLWQGYPDDAARSLDDLSSPLDSRVVTDFRLTQQLLGYTHPTLAGYGDARGSRRDASEGPAGQSAAVLDAVFARGSAERVTTGAERVLRSYRLDDETVEPLVAAVFALIYVDNNERAAAWCDALIAQAQDRGAESWVAVLYALRARVSLSQGDLSVVAAQANEALSRMAEQNWGPAIGLPLAMRLRALTAMGELDAAAELLRHPVPDAMFESTFGVGYLHARAHYYLATDNLHAALGDFVRCGEMVRERGQDLPTIVPWRVDAARVYLRLGRPEKARELVSEQLSLSTGRGPRMRGMALRVLAGATDQLTERADLLKQAVDLMHNSGDRVELAYALADLSRAYQVTGDFERARVMSRRAMQMAKASHAKALYRELAPSRVLIRNDRVQDSAPANGVALLSDAERRVAVLAARGHTNREIGRKLFITVSTVEQHLTRVYRKLNVQRRADLRVQAVTWAAG